VVTAFLAASKGGDFTALVELLHPEAVLRYDAAAASMGSATDLRGADAVAKFLSGKARAARLVLVDGAPGWVWSHLGEPQVVFAFTVEDGLVTAIEIIGDRDRVTGFEIESLAQR
jgi:RNA polymerase sigma-70 factor (ECF subfamily)